MLEACQRQEQRGFHPQGRLEPHLVFANLLVDNFLAINKFVWVISLDLSKAFDIVDWNKLWVALVDEGVSEHIAWIMPRLYFSQRGCGRGA